jgi:SAM-dependent methyltransferase
MTDRAGKGSASGGNISKTLHKRDFWSQENLKYSRPHYRLEKSARIINRLARGRSCTLLDVGCGPAALMPLLRPNIQYHGIDIAIHDPAPNLIEADFLEVPIRFGDKHFDIILAQGVFEYVGDFQAQKFAEIAELLNGDGVFMVSYVNFDHRERYVYKPYSNVQTMADFRQSLARHFIVNKSFPTSYNWKHSEPGRKLLKAANINININVPFVGRALAVEYFFICSARLPVCDHPAVGERCGGPDPGGKRRQAG